ncbi:unnamed protein product [Brachionus calyciflorus]|uniref:Uncharacterized protein n=1 Tax=Brachionus calyciflorus TaxID=104777 RepID=A0A813MBL1_9BILA|nr:unnamed protein product [Brachionus calyciflorus]
MLRLPYKKYQLKLVRNISISVIFQSTKTDENGYRSVPHYTQKSALYIKPPHPSSTSKDESIFSKIVSPELNMDRLFETKNIQNSMLNLNLTARHIHLDLDHLQKDYFKMRSLEDQISLLNKEKETISDQINNLVKSKGGTSSKKSTMQSSEAKKLLKSANEIKLKINKILEELIPLQEIVNIACLRLPNSLHYSTLYLHKYHLKREIDRNLFVYNDDENDENFRPVLFEFNTEAKKLAKNNTSLLDGTNNWQTVLQDCILIDDQIVPAKYTNKNLDDWSFVEQSPIDAVLHNRYLSGTYSKLEQCLSEYFHDKIQGLNSKDSELENFEHIKSASMFKSAIVEGCGRKFNDFRNTYNVVRFGSGSSGSSTELLHLNGASSISALTLNFVRTKIKRKYLPWTVYTNAKTYSPKKGQLNSFDFLTLTADNSSYLYKYDNESKSSQGLTDDFLQLILNNGKFYLDEIKQKLSEYTSKKEHPLDDLNHSAKSIDDILISYLKLFIYAYKDFKNIPFKFVCLNAYDLKGKDSFKIKVKAYLPSEQNYVTIGEVCLLNDYISSRLQIRLDVDKGETRDQSSLKHVNMIYCKLVDLNVFTQILIESNLKINSKNETQNDEILSESGVYDIEKNLLFELPSFLKKYYLI